ncbi:hypothetical protein O1W69_04540 [Chlamydia sp. 12-01]|uniref:hypothetical protein n=1 Tax=Chlamydia sp. 12-01 TaxID=3002742 RepID=UPI0035D3D929
MTAAHGYGAFAGRPSRNVFTINDLDHKDSTDSHSRETSKRTVSIGRPWIERYPTCPMVQHTALWVILGLAATLSTCLLLASGYCSIPTIIAVLVIQIALIVVSITCLIIKHKREISSKLCGQDQ